MLFSHRVPLFPAFCEILFSYSYFFFSLLCFISSFLKCNLFIYFFTISKSFVMINYLCLALIALRYCLNFCTSSVCWKCSLNYFNTSAKFFDWNLFFHWLPWKLWWKEFQDLWGESLKKGRGWAYLYKSHIENIHEQESVHHKSA